MVTFAVTLLTCFLTVWLENKQLRKLVVVISNIQTKEVLERWQFDIETDAVIQQDGYFDILFAVFLYWKKIFDKKKRTGTDYIPKMVCY